MSTLATTMIDRFKGRAGRPLLVQALRAQTAVGNDASLAEELAGAVVLVEFHSGKRLINQGDSDNSLYFILSGTVFVLVNGREVAKRSANDHVGEMALLEPGAPRSATVTAVQDTVAARIDEPAFASIAEKFPALWRSLAAELAERLRQRGRFHTQPNERPKLFIGSTREQIALAERIQRGLRDSNIDSSLWCEGVFEASHHTMEDLETQLRGMDFALIVVTPDDIVESRTTTHAAPRDNVVFELGLFMGAISRSRTFLLRPRDVDLKIPSDLMGLKPLSYDPQERRVLRQIEPAIKELKRMIAALGVR